MPKIDDLINNPKRKFKKIAYRPWNYMDNIEREMDGDLKLDNVEKENLIVGMGGDVEKKYDEASKKTEPVLEVIFSLTGYQKKIFFMIIEVCLSRGMLSTGCIKSDSFVELTGTTSNMIRTSIKRLVNKGLVIRGRGKTGRGGFHSFSISEIVRSTALDYKRLVKDDSSSEKNREEKTGNKFVEKPNIYANSPPTESEWENIDIEPLKSIGFSPTQLKQLLSRKLNTLEVVQESIYHFAFGLENNPETQRYKDDGKNPLNVLMGVLRKGAAWFEPTYRSPKEIAQAQLLEQRKAQKAREKQLENDAYELAFDDWLDGLAKDERASIVAKKNKSDIVPEKVKLGAHFRDKIWPTQKNDYLVAS